MSHRVFVSGYGIVSALGFGAEANLNALKQQVTGIAPPQFLKTKHCTLPVGEVKASNESLAEMAGVSDKKPVSRTVLLGLIAAREAVEKAGLDEGQLRTSGLISGTTVGGMDISEHAYQSLQKGERVDYTKSFSGHDCGHSTQAIATGLRLSGALSTISTACSSSANTIMQAARLIKAGQVERVIAGGTDALSLFTLNGFNSLKILDAELCKPFDEHRQGLNLGEGAAYLVLESEAALNARGGVAYAEVTGYGNANDAYHQTASSPEGKGAFLAIKKAFEIAGKTDLTIDYVNAHGTGTANNDLSESNALKMIFNDQVPALSSTKSYTGHTLGAAGAVEAVFSVLAILGQHVYGNYNLSLPMSDGLEPERNFRSIKIDHVLSNSFGFGGNCSSLIFSKV
ncbi:3-oxoacyl-[acyl-carrier-protein] synthase, KASII [Fulvivirga imtechensis AK7]|uniref:3-oxoacyl-[acyl-carrier-protein] synthase, KASII n=1 Tax=Fulvivirga imtechensis AK7 TaxID=1237149 RepID=L8JSZ6_9BACT|nr:beta-ketoacyl-[acyl-carrier-protein] synthase family protein [Fulvivirga imtechensis]ELR71308.1 3-oxoacyl-[acyl-carrier-protein] synthase, KASII [Fulvivirga imtechensis AK7]